MRIIDNIVSLYYRSATGKLKNRNLLTLTGFILFSCAMILFIVISLRFDKIFGFPEFLNEPLANIISFPLMSTGLLIIIWCIICFLKAKGTPVPFSPPKQLVTSGPYSFSRNPMVSGLIIFMFGFGIYAQSVSLTFIFVPVFVFLSWLELKLIEEPEIEKRFGNDYIVYKRKVPMFFPSFK
jgi:protein-S-isoprenylcysteine O-methyltransferase Ste14